MFTMIKRWFSVRRINKLYADERFRDEMPCLRIGYDETIYFDHNLDGDPVAFHTPSMRYIDIESVHYKSGGYIEWHPRDRPRWEHRFDTVPTVTSFLIMKNAAYWAGVPFARVNGETFFLTRDCIKPQYVELTKAGGDTIRIPKAAFCDFPENKLLKPNIYTMHPIDCYTGDEIEDWERIIEVKPAGQDIVSAYTTLTEVPGCPGLLDFKSSDVVIHINALDNSALPIVDLKPFLEAVRDGIKHETKRWTLDIEQIQLQIGMNPKPIKIMDLASELPHHRIILSDLPNRWSEETYVNKTNLPVTYP